MLMFAELCRVHLKSNVKGLLRHVPYYLLSILAVGLHSPSLVKQPFMARMTTDDHSERCWTGASSVSIAWSETVLSQWVVAVHHQGESAGTAAPSKVAQVPLARRVGKDMGKRAAPKTHSQPFRWLLKRRSSSSRGAHR